MNKKKAMKLPCKTFCLPNFSGNEQQSPSEIRVVGIEAQLGWFVEKLDICTLFGNVSQEHYYIFFKKWKSEKCIWTLNDSHFNEKFLQNVSRNVPSGNKNEEMSGCRMPAFLEGLKIR